MLVTVRLRTFTSSRLPGTFKNLIIPCNGLITKPHSAPAARIWPSTCRRYGLNTFHVNMKIDAVTTHM